MMWSWLGRQAEAASAAERADAAAEAALMKAKESERQKRIAEKKLVRIVRRGECPVLPIWGAWLDLC